MRLIKDLLGGVLIITVAGAVAIAQNAARKDGIPLLPRASSVGKPEVPSAIASPSDSTASSTALGNPTSVPTEDELSAGLITADRLRALMAGAADRSSLVVVDARLPAEYEAGHIAGAVNIPYEQLPRYYERISEMVPYGAVVICYCQSVTCDDSENLARELKFMGYRDVLLYKGGWDEWSAAGYPSAATDE